MSKYPSKFRELCRALDECPTVELFIITDMHDREMTLAMLKDNDFGFIPESHVLNSDYTNLGEACKAVLLKEHRIDLFFDDFGGYVQWDSQLGEAPIRMLVQPNMFKPYWSDEWKTGPEQWEFGRRVAPLDLTPYNK